MKRIPNKIRTLMKDHKEWLRWLWKRLQTLPERLRSEEKV